MQIIKSLYAGLIHRTYSYQGKHYATFSLLWGVNLLTNKPLMEPDVWGAVGKIGQGGILDYGLPKIKGEVLVAGKFYGSTDSQNVTAGQVKLKIGKIEKTLAVFGDRKWTRTGGITSPEPLTELPLSYDSAFGGEGFAQNPTGRGFRHEKKPAASVDLLPNIENPARLICSRNDCPAPAGFGRIDPEWEPRCRLRGTYDEKYIKKRMPGFPDDLDWSCFNEAPEDQWLDGYFEGNESFELGGMHSQLRSIRGQLPGVKGRCFVAHRIQGEDQFKEVPCKLDTVLLFPDIPLGIMIYRGTLEVFEDDGCDIRQVLIAHENLRDETRSVEHYREQLRLRTDPEEGFKYMLNSGPLIPNGCRGWFEQLQDDLAEEDSSKNLMGQNIETYALNKQVEYQKLVDEKMAEAKDQQQKILHELKDSDAETSAVEKALEEALTQSGAFAEAPAPQATAEALKIRELIENILPGAMSPESPVDISRLNLKGFDDFTAYMEDLTHAKKDEATKKVKQRLIKAKEQGDFEKIKDLLKGEDFATMPGMGQAADSFSETVDLDQLIESLEAKPDAAIKAPLPRLNLTTQLEAVKEKLADLDATMDHARKEIGTLTSVQEAPSTEEMDQMIENFLHGDRMDELKGGLEKTCEQLKMAEKQARDGYAMGAHFMENSCSPHSGEEEKIACKLLEDFRAGMPTAEGDYAFIDLKGQNLTGIDLSGAYLEYVDFGGTNLSGANLSGAIMAHARLVNTDLTGADLRGTNIGATTIEGSRFVDVDLTGATLGKARIKDSLFQNCQFGDRQDLFLETEFERVDFTRSNLSASHFIEQDLSDCCFAKADLSQANFLQSKLHRANFKEAILAGANFVEAQIHQGNFQAAQMKNVRFIGDTSLIESTFFGADLCEANLRDCDLRSTNFTLSKLQKADLSGSDLSLAVLNRAEAFQTQFIKSNLSFARLLRINLMEGSLMKANLEGADFSGANLFSVSFLGSRLKLTNFTEAYMVQTSLPEEKG